MRRGPTAESISVQSTGGSGHRSDLGSERRHTGCISFRLCSQFWPRFWRGAFHFWMTSRPAATVVRGVSHVAARPRRCGRAASPAAPGPAALHRIHGARAFRLCSQFWPRFWWGTGRRAAAGSCASARPAAARPCPKWSTRRCDAVPRGLPVPDRENIIVLIIEISSLLHCWVARRARDRTASRIVTYKHTCVCCNSTIVLWCAL